jgi:hypothetical protein
MIHYQYLRRAKRAGIKLTEAKSRFGRKSYFDVEFFDDRDSATCDTAREALEHAESWIRRAKRLERKSVELSDWGDYIGAYFLGWEIASSTDSMCEVIDRAEDWFDWVDDEVESIMEISPSTIRRDADALHGSAISNEISLSFIQTRHQL